MKKALLSLGGGGQEAKVSRAGVRIRVQPLSFPCIFFETSEISEHLEDTQIQQKNFSAPCDTPNKTTFGTFSVQPKSEIGQRQCPPGFCFSGGGGGGRGLLEGVRGVGVRKPQNCWAVTQSARRIIIIIIHINESLTCPMQSHSVDIRNGLRPASVIVEVWDDVFSSTPNGNSILANLSASAARQQRQQSSVAA